MHACVRPSVRPSVRPCVRACACVRASVRPCVHACVCACNKHVGSLITVAYVYSRPPPSPQCSRLTPHAARPHPRPHHICTPHAQALANMGHAYFAAGMDQLQAGEDETACEALCRARDAFRLQLQLAEEAGDDEGVGQACGCVRACVTAPASLLSPRKKEG
jgi:hypothetical protein